MVSLHKMNDSELMTLLQAGSQPAFTVVFERYNKLLYSHAYNKLRAADDARDLVQEVFAGLWEKRNSLTDKNLGGLLFTMLRNRIINMVSHQQIVSDYTNKLAVYNRQDFTPADHRIREKMLAELIELEISYLPPRMRQIFLMSRMGHLSNKEIARQLNLSEHTVADQIKKSLRILKPRIQVIIVFASILLISKSGN